MFVPLAAVIIAVINVSAVTAQGLQFAIKDQFFEDLKANYLPMIYDKFGTGYDIDSHSFGNKWAGINLTKTVLSIPGDRDQFTNNFKISPPKDGQSNFGIKMNQVSLDVESSFLLRLLLSKTNGFLHLLISKIDIDLQFELATQENPSKQMAPKVNINKLEIEYDKKNTKLDITGGMVPWMLQAGGLIPWMLQASGVPPWIPNSFNNVIIDYILDFAINKLKIEVKTTLIDMVNQMALSGFKQYELGDGLAASVQLSQRPSEVYETFMLGFNATFMLEDPKTLEKIHSASQCKKVMHNDFKNKMNTDFAMAIQFDGITQFAKDLYKANKTISMGTILHHFSPDQPLLCDSAIVDVFPNIEYDFDCEKRFNISNYTYPISLDLSLPTEPKGVWFDDENNRLVIDVDSFRSRMVRTDKDRVVMDFILKGIQLNISLSLDEMLQPNFDYNFTFSDVKMMERGSLIKSERDIWKLNGEQFGFLDAIGDQLPKNFRYLNSMTNRIAAILLDKETQAIYIGVTPDPIFLGKNQFQPKDHIFDPIPSFW